MQYLKQNRVIELFQVYSTRSEAIDSFKSSIPAEQNTVKDPNISVGDTPIKQSGESFAGAFDISPSVKSRFETGEILYANSCMLATLIKMLETKGMLSPEEAGDLMDYERLSLKGVDE